MTELITKKAAQSLGLRHYFTGKPCPRGHICARYVSDYSCIECREKHRRRDLDKERDRSRKRREENPEATRESCRKWQEKNPGYETRWRNLSLENLEKARARGRRYAKRNRPKARANEQRKRARKRLAAGFFCAGDIERIGNQQRHRCAACRKKLTAADTHIDHIIPLAKGGSNWPRNLQLLCRTCNLSKSDTDPLDYARRIGRLL